MRRTLFYTVFLCILLVFALTACRTSVENTAGTDSASQQTASTTDMRETGTTQQTDTDISVNTEETSNGSKILVVYFSRTGEQYDVGVIDKGNTAIVAEIISEETGADTFEILPADDYYPYTYDELTDVALQEQNEGARPAIAGTIPDLSEYDTIFIGAPVWWGDWPMIMYTFFEENADALSGKTLIPFSTHAGSGLSGFDTKLSNACPDSTVLAGLGFRGSDAQENTEAVRENVRDWISELGL